MNVAGYAVSNGDQARINVTVARDYSWLSLDKMIGHVSLIRKGEPMPPGMTVAQAGDILFAYLYPTSTCPWPSYRVAEVIKEK